MIVMVTPLVTRFLLELQTSLKNTVKQDGIIGRYGGEEFIVILPNTCEAEAFFLGEKIRRQIEKVNFDIGINVTISIGIAEVDNSDLKIVERADAMLYHAKKTGRNRVVCYSHIS